MDRQRRWMGTVMVGLAACLTIGLYHRDPTEQLSLSELQIHLRTQFGLTRLLLPMVTELYRVLTARLR